MAHLARCWCGKTYRCEMEHYVGSRLCFMEEDCACCPDVLLHGPSMPRQIVFYTISTERFSMNPPSKYVGTLTDILTDNSVKE